MNRSQDIMTWIRLHITRRPKRIGDRNGGPLYRVWCPTHGYFEDIPRGWDQVFRCPECFKEQFSGGGIKTTDQKFTLIISNKSVFIFKGGSEGALDLVAQYDPVATHKVRFNEVVDWLLSDQIKEVSES